MFEVYVRGGLLTGSSRAGGTAAEVGSCVRARARAAAAAEAVGSRARSSSAAKPGTLQLLQVHGVMVL